MRKEADETNYKYLGFKTFNSNETDLVNFRFCVYFFTYPLV